MSAIEELKAFSTPPSPIKRRPLKFLHTEKNRHGTVCYYFRRDKNSRRIRLRAEPGSPEFDRQYADALAGKKPLAASFIYFMTAGNKVKIGVSRNPRRRLDDLKTGSSRMVSIRYVTPGDRTKEKELHKLFAEHRVNGEWFLFATAIRDWIAADEAARLAERGLQ
jgi:hypothetical protein